ncbi:MAG: ABC transporter permease [Candidatus Aminicenantes bacterium]|nr:ABC transporter permease [Candidatus Aminicenantes bacterium]MBL7082697.1 ABC transporter permease [Candidatus Aminicenantes bacterium]
MKNKFIHEIREIYSFRHLLVNLIKSDIKLRYKNSFLGFLWHILNPLFYLGILALVFSQIIRIQMENYILFLFAGLVSWRMIQQTSIIATHSIVNNQELIKKIYTPKLIFPLATVISQYIDHLTLSLILFIFLFILKGKISFVLFLSPVVIILIFIFSLGLSLFFATSYVYVKDTPHIIAIGFQALFFLTPILYPLSVLSPKLEKFFKINPLYYFVEYFRYPFYYAKMPPLEQTCIVCGLSLITFGLGIYIFLRKKESFIFKF